MNGANAPFKWTQVPDFEHPAHPEWDLIQWDLEDVLVWAPRRVSQSVYEPPRDPPDDWRFLVTTDAPGLQHLPSCIVIFRIVSNPDGKAPGMLEGHAAWWDDELDAALMARVRAYRGH